MGFHKMANEFLIRKICEVSFLRLVGQVALGLEDSIKGGLGKAAQGSSVASSRCVAVINTSYHQELLGHQGALEAGMRCTSTEPQWHVTLQGTVCSLPILFPQ